MDKNMLTTAEQNSTSPDEILGKFLETYFDANQQPKTVNKKPFNDVLAAVYLMRQRTYNEVMLTALKPELVYNERQKRVLKLKLMKYIKRVLAVQIFLLGIIVLSSCVSISFIFPFVGKVDVRIIEMMFDFLKYYITAIIAEFIAMLFFIVKFVFDKSIVVLIKQLFKKND